MCILVARLRMRYGTSSTRLRHHDGEAVRRAIQNSQESLRALARRYGMNQKLSRSGSSATPSPIVRLALRRPSRPSFPSRRRRSSSLSGAYAAATRRVLYALQPTIPHLTRSSLHRCLQRHGISRLPEVEAIRLRRRSSRLIRSTISTSISLSSRPLSRKVIVFFEQKLRPLEQDCRMLTRSAGPPIALQH